MRRVAAGVRAGKDRGQVFPKLSTIGAAISGEGLTVEVRFVKTDGLPVRLVKNDDAEGTVDAAAIRFVDLTRKYHRSPTELARALGMTAPKLGALREHLGVDADESCRHVFGFGSQRHVRYSDNAFTRMRAAVADGLDMDAVWAAHGAGRRRGVPPSCNLPGCAIQVKAS